MIHLCPDDIKKGLNTLLNIPLDEIEIEPFVIPVPLDIQPNQTTLYVGVKSFIQTTTPSKYGVFSQFSTQESYASFVGYQIKTKKLYSALSVLAPGGGQQPEE